MRNIGVFRVKCPNFEWWGLYFLSLVSRTQRGESISGVKNIFEKFLHAQNGLKMRNSAFLGQMAKFWMMVKDEVFSGSGVVQWEVGNGQWEWGMGSSVHPLPTAQFPCQNWVVVWFRVRVRFGGSGQWEVGEWGMGSDIHPLRTAHSPLSLP